MESSHQEKSIDNKKMALAIKQLKLIKESIKDQSQKNKKIITQ